MPSAIRGHVHRYDYGPNVGRELSDFHPALIISNTELNRNLYVAIAFPMSSTTPPEQHRRNHAFIADVGSWASLRQIKSVEQARLGAKIGEASPQELETALEVLTASLTNRRNRPGTIQTLSGYERIEAGTVWDIEFHDQDDTAYKIPTLILDYNDGNKMGIAIEIGYRQRPDSRLRIPIVVENSVSPASALIHRVRSVDVEARPMEKIGVVEEASLQSVISALLWAIDE